MRLHNHGEDDAPHEGLSNERLPEGTRIGSLVCEYGQWVEKPEKP